MGERLQSKKTYVCSFFDCKATFSKAWKLDAHLCKHTGLKPFSCDSCDRSFCTRYQLTRHEFSHGGEKPHKCPADGCAEAFVRHASLKNHMARIHQQQEKQFKCDHQGCEKDFNKRNQLKAHQCEHQESLPFHCSLTGCTREFLTLKKLKRHEKMHQGYPCETDGCPFQGKTWSDFLKHRKEHKDKVLCGRCNKLLSNVWFLRLHELRVHSGEKRMFPCPREGCEKKFTRRFNLESHVLGDHEGKKPFGCAVPGCDKSFAMKESLWRHGVVHDPAKKRLKKLHPKKNRPWRTGQQAGLAAAANQVAANALAAKLHSTTLENNRP